MKKYNEFIKENKQSIDDYEKNRKMFKAMAEPLKALFQKMYGHTPDKFIVWEEHDHSIGNSPIVVCAQVTFRVTDPYDEENDLKTTSELMKEQAMIIDHCIDLSEKLKAYKAYNLSTIGMSSADIKIKFRIDRKDFFSNPLIKSLMTIGKYKM